MKLYISIKILKYKINNKYNLKKYFIIDFHGFK